MGGAAALLINEHTYITFCGLYCDAKADKKGEIPPYYFTINHTIPAPISSAAATFSTRSAISS